MINIEETWEEVESHFPCLPSSVINEGYYYSDDSIYCQLDGPDDAFWKTRFVFLLLVLCAEGESIT